MLAWLRKLLGVDRLNAEMEVMVRRVARLEAELRTLENALGMPPADKPHA